MFTGAWNSYAPPPSVRLLVVGRKNVLAVAATARDSFLHNLSLEERASLEEHQLNKDKKDLVPHDSSIFDLRPMSCGAVDLLPVILPPFLYLYIQPEVVTIRLRCTKNLGLEIHAKSCVLDVFNLREHSLWRLAIV